MNEKVLKIMTELVGETRGLLDDPDKTMDVLVFEANRIHTVYMAEQKEAVNDALKQQAKDFRMRQAAKKGKKVKKIESDEGEDSE